MTDSNAGWYGTILGDGARPKQGPLASRQYGPAHVADVTTGTTHEQRIDALRTFGTDPELLDHLVTSGPDDVAKAYARSLDVERGKTEGSA